MAPLTENEPPPSGNEEEDDDDVFNEDMEALRRACMLTGTNPDDLTNNAENDRHLSSDSDDDDLELLRQIRSRFSKLSDTCEPLSLKPLCSLPVTVSDEEEDDFQTLLAVQKRFAAYENDTMKKSMEQVVPSCKSVKETRSDISDIKTDAHEKFRDSEDSCLAAHPLSDNEAGQPSDVIEWHQSDSCRPSMLPPKYSSFPKSAQVFMDAIKKNRSCQKFLRSKLIQIEAKIEENKKLKQRVKILKDFQVSCKKRTGDALSQKKDPRVQLILVKRSRASRDLKTHDKKISAMCYGPEENSHVANYKMALTKFLPSLDRKKWSEVEKKDLEKGIRQQFQEMVLQFSVDQSSCSERPYGDSNDIDSILALIKDLEITPENIREFLPKVNWEQLASMYVVGRSAGECEARWLNWEDPLINHKSWTANEDKNLLYLVQEKGINDWFDIAVSLGTSRTPFQCLARYQRSLNASILKREWTKDEDVRLRSAVEAFGEGDWQSVASALGGRTGPQCSNRWKKSLHPTRKREGRWTPEEDKRLKVAQMLFGPKNWNKTAQFVPGRTQAQCRDRYVNCLEPSLKCGKWTEEEDSRLSAAIAEHGYCWSKVAACVPRRTDNMCLRRWKVLFPHDVPLFKEAKRIQKAALICNFVDREAERSALCPNDFLPPLELTPTKTLTYHGKKNGKLRPHSGKKKNLSSRDVPKKIRPRRHRNSGHSCDEEVHGINNCDEVEICNGNEASNKTASHKKNKVLKQQHRKRKGTEPTGDCQVVEPVPDKHDTHKEPREMPCSDQIVGRSDRDATLGTFLLCNKLKKRKVEVDCAVQNSAPLDASNNTASNKKNKVLKQKHRRHKGTEPTGECQVVVPVPYKHDTHKEPREMSCLDQIVGTSDGDDTTLACLVCNKLKKRKVVVADYAVQDCPAMSIQRGSELHSEVDQLPDGNQILSLNQDDEFMVHCADRISEKLSPCNVQSSKLNDKSTNEPGGIKFVRGIKVALQKPVREVVGINPESDLDTGDIVLASLVKKKLKKRHLQTAKSGPQACPPPSVTMRSELLPERVDQPNNGNQMALVAVGNEPGVVDLDKQQEVDHCEPVRGLVNIGAEGDHEDSDLTLACFLRNVSKKRRRQSVKGGIQRSR